MKNFIVVLHDHTKEVFLQTGKKLKEVDFSEIAKNPSIPITLLWNDSHQFYEIHPIPPLSWMDRRRFLKNLCFAGSVVSLSKTHALTLQWGPYTPSTLPFLSVRRFCPLPLAVRPLKTGWHLSEIIFDQGVCYVAHHDGDLCLVRYTSQPDQEQTKHFLIKEMGAQDIAFHQLPCHEVYAKAIRTLSDMPQEIAPLYKRGRFLLWIQRMTCLLLLALGGEGAGIAWQKHLLEKASYSSQVIQPPLLFSPESQKAIKQLVDEAQPPITDVLFLKPLLKILNPDWHVLKIEWKTGTFKISLVAKIREQAWEKFNDLSHHPLLSTYDFIVDHSPSFSNSPFQSGRVEATLRLKKND